LIRHDDDDEANRPARLHGIIKDDVKKPTSSLSKSNFCRTLANFVHIHMLKNGFVCRFQEGNAEEDVKSTISKTVKKSL
jgi:hypothetical protein